MLLFKNGSKILFNTYDQDRDAWAGVGSAALGLTRSRRASTAAGSTRSRSLVSASFFQMQVCFTMTPLFGLSWTYDEIYERRTDPDVSVIVASMRDNPHIPWEETIRQLEHLSEAERRAVIDGEFVHFHGAVLDVREHHVVPAVSPDQIVGRPCMWVLTGDS